MKNPLSTRTAKVAAGLSAGIIGGVAAWIADPPPAKTHFYNAEPVLNNSFKEQMNEKLEGFFRARATRDAGSNGL